MSSHAPYEPEAHIFRWDLDKTYIRSEFSTVKDLIRTALQGPADKTNVPGSAELIRALRGDSAGKARIYFISGSPRQMRGVLTDKLRLDGVHFDGFILKDNLRNLLKGRFRALKEQVGYKLPALLQSRGGEDIALKETLFGDDAERDAFVYSLYADLIAERVPADILASILEMAGVYPDSREAIYVALNSITPCDPVERIIIHLDQRSPPIRFDAYGSRLVPVYNYFQAALVLYQDRRIRARTVGVVAESLLREHDYTIPVLERSFQDLARRSAVDAAALERLVDEGRLAGLPDALIQIFAVRPTATPTAPSPNPLPDYPTLLARELQRHRLARRPRRIFGP